MVLCINNASGASLPPDAEQNRKPLTIPRALYCAVLAYSEAVEGAVRHIHTLPEKCVKLFTSETKDQLPPVVPGKPTEVFSSFSSPNKPTRLFNTDRDPPPSRKACVVITTFSMLCHSGHRAEEAERMLGAIKEREWGLLLLNEVHVAPAKMFRRVLELVNAHCKVRRGEPALISTPRIAPRITRSYSLLLNFIEFNVYTHQNICLLVHV